MVTTADSSLLSVVLSLCCFSNLGGNGLSSTRAVNTFVANSGPVCQLIEFLVVQSSRAAAVAEYCCALQLNQWSQCSLAPRSPSSSYTPRSRENSRNTPPSCSGHSDVHISSSLPSTPPSQAASPNISPNSALGVVLEQLSASFDNFTERIDLTVLAELHLQAAAAYKNLDEAKHQMSWNEGYKVGLDLGRIEGCKEGATQMRREVRAEVQDSLRRERMRRKCEVATQTAPPSSPGELSSSAAVSSSASKTPDWADEVDKDPQPHFAPVISVVSAPRDLSALRPAPRSKLFGS